MIWCTYRPVAWRPVIARFGDDQAIFQKIRWSILNLNIILKIWFFQKTKKSRSKMCKNRRETSRDPQNFKHPNNVFFSCFSQSFLPTPRIFLPNKIKYATHCRFLQYCWCDRNKLYILTGLRTLLTTPCSFYIKMAPIWRHAVTDYSVFSIKID